MTDFILLFHSFSFHLPFNLDYTQTKHFELWFSAGRYLVRLHVLELGLGVVVVVVVGGRND